MALLLKGDLADPDLLEIVGGGTVALSGHVEVEVEVGDAGAEARWLYYLRGLGLEGTPDILSDGAQALAFEVSNGAWDLETERHVAREAMIYFGEIGAEELAERLPGMRMRAYSRVLAARNPVPPPLAPLPEGGVEVVKARMPYAKFFSVAEYDVTHPRFDGARSPVVNRAAFMAADAVVVLPYDPVRDRVHLIEQFRMGPFFRGDAHTFLIEAIAGRIDPGESPEETARREAREEAGLDLGALHEAARGYPSPGAVSEYLYIYVGIADLPDAASGLGGLETEDEDIRSHILDYADFEERLDKGGLNVGPLQIAGHWLARNRSRLRA